MHRDEADTFYSNAELWDLLKMSFVSQLISAFGNREAKNGTGDENRIMSVEYNISLTDWSIDKVSEKRSGDTDFPPPSFPYYTSTKGGGEPVAVAGSTTTDLQ